MVVDIVSHQYGVFAGLDAADRIEVDAVRGHGEVARVDRQSDGEQRGLVDIAAMVVEPGGLFTSILIAVDAGKLLEGWGGVGCRRLVMGVGVAC